MRRPTVVFEWGFGFRSDTLRLRGRRAIPCLSSGNGALEKARTLLLMRNRGQHGAGSGIENVAGVKRCGYGGVSAVYTSGL